MVRLITIYDTISCLFYNVKYDFAFFKGYKNDSFSQFTSVYKWYKNLRVKIEIGEGLPKEVLIVFNQRMGGNYNVQSSLF